MAIKYLMDEKGYLEELFKSFLYTIYFNSELLTEIFTKPGR